MPDSPTPPESRTSPAAADAAVGDAGRPALDASDRRTGVAAAKVLAAGVLGLVLAMVLNSQQLLREAQQKPFGAERDAAVAVWSPVEGASSAVGLHLPRLWADQALGRSVSDPGSSADDIVASAPESVAAETADAAAGDATSPGLVVASEPDPAATGDDSADASAGADPASSPDGADAGSAGLAGTDQGQQEPSTPVPDAAASEPPTTVPWFPTPDDPLRLHVLGDSMVRFFGDTMVSLANDTGVIDATTEHELSSGLSRPDFYDWPARLVEVMASEDPDAVVLMIGGNDAQSIVVDGQIARPFSDAWMGEYSARVGHAMDLVTTDPDRLLIWVGQPIMESPDYDENMRRISEVYAAEAAERDRVRYVDIRDLFRGPNGGFSRYVAAQDGQLADVRLTDGVHLSTLGGRWLSELLLGELGALVDLASGAPS